MAPIKRKRSENLDINKYNLRSKKQKIVKSTDEFRNNEKNRDNRIEYSEICYSDSDVKSSGDYSFKRNKTFSSDLGFNENTNSYDFSTNSRDTKSIENNQFIASDISNLSSESITFSEDIGDNESVDDDLNSSLERNKDYERSISDNKKTLKIVTWNVGGLRALLDKGILTNYIIKENPDIMVVQQTRCTKEQLLKYSDDFDNISKSYYVYWDDAYQGQGGVGLLSKQKPITVHYGVPNFSTKEGRFIKATFPNFVLITVYVPNSGIGLKNIKQRLQWDVAFQDYLHKFHNQNKKIILSGDFNVCLNPIDLANPDKNKKTAGFTIEERRNFSDLLDLGFIDTFRYLYPKKSGAYTYWSFRNKMARQNNKGWRLDYHLVSEELKKNIKDCIIRSDIKGTTHCPVELFMKI